MRRAHVKNNLLIIFATIIFFLCCYRFDSLLWAKTESQVDQKPLVVIIPSYKNAHWYLLNLSSIFNQEYTNYRIIYISDDPQDSDKTYELVCNYIKIKNQSHRCTVIKNKQRKGALENLYHAVHSCRACEIVLAVDGDDWLVNNNQVFNIINGLYKEHDIVMTYGQFITYPQKQLGICAPLPDWVIEQNAFRNYKWVTSHLRTFYAGLFKCIEKGELCDENGNFFSITGDQAFIFSLLERAGKHIYFYPEPLYVYNQSNPLNDFRIHLKAQLQAEKKIREKSKAEPLSLQEIRKIQGVV